MRKTSFRLLQRALTAVTAFALAIGNASTLPASDFSPSQAMDLYRESHETEPNLLQWYFPATPLQIQQFYPCRSPNRYVPVQQVMWGTMMQWTNNRYNIPGYVPLGVTSWATSIRVTQALGEAYTAAFNYSPTGNTARKLGADYAVYSNEYRNDPVMGVIDHMQAAYFIKAG